MNYFVFALQVLMISCWYGHIPVNVSFLKLYKIYCIILISYCIIDINPSVRFVLIKTYYCIILYHTNAYLYHIAVIKKTIFFSICVHLTITSMQKIYTCISSNKYTSIVFYNSCYRGAESASISLSHLKTDNSADDSVGFINVIYR